MWHLLCDNECHLNTHKGGENIEKYIVNEYIQGDPLAEENLEKSLEIVNKIRLLFPEKSIWIYTGYTFEEIFMRDIQNSNANVLVFLEEDEFEAYRLRQIILSKCDVMVDGRYIDSKRDITFPWAGSTNQRVISIQQSLKENRIVVHLD